MRLQLTDCLPRSGVLLQRGRAAAVLLVALTAALLSAPTARATDVWTQQNDNARTGLNTEETILTPSNVNADKFGKLFARSVDGYISAQPLVMSNVVIPGKGTHNVVYVCTQHDTVYAFDADSNTGGNAEPLWQISLGPSTPSTITVGSGCVDNYPEYGIQGTPVIDRDTGTLYVLAKTWDIDDATVDPPVRTIRQRLHALNIATGEEKFGGPTIIEAAVPGTGDDSVGGIVRFNARTEKNTPALLLSKPVRMDGARPVVYIPFASHCDNGPYHGWVLGYDAATLQQVGVFNTSPNGGLNGIWQGGKGLASDDDGNIYFETGNGTADTDRFGLVDAHLGNYSEAFVKLSRTQTGALQVADWFTPFNYDILNNQDNDLGGGGPMLLPGTDLLVGGGKEGKMYLLDRNNLGHFQPGSDSQILQSWRTPGGAHVHNFPVYFEGPDGPLIYTWREYTLLEAFKFVPGERTGDGRFLTTPIATNTVNNGGHPGGEMVVTSNGKMDGILWALSPDIDANWRPIPGTMFAYDATSFTADGKLKELWNSKQYFDYDDFEHFSKFGTPTVANGKLYVPTYSDQLVVYGLIPEELVVPPAVRIIRPATGAVTLARDIQVCANAFARNATVTKVDFLIDNNPDPITVTGPDNPHCVTLPNVSPGRHILRAVVTNSKGATASSNAVIVIVAESLAVNSGGGAVGRFVADTGFQGGNTASRTDPVDVSGIDPAKVAPQAVYQTERYGNFSYAVAAEPNTDYTVRLHFNEFATAGPGGRVMNVDINGQRVLDKYEIWTDVGGMLNKATIKEFPVTTGGDGLITISFAADPSGRDANAKVSGIEVFPGSP